MVGHHDKCIQRKFLPDLGGFEPLFPRNLAAIIFVHVVFDHTAEDALFVERAYPYDPRAGKSPLKSRA
jgi:hypothetical protein